MENFYIQPKVNRTYKSTLTNVIKIYDKEEYINTTIIEDEVNERKGEHRYRHFWSNIGRVIRRIRDVIPDWEVG